MNKTLILFAKVPRPGKVKTRLQPDISPERGCELYRAFIDDLLATTRSLKNVKRIMGCDPSQSDPYFEALSEKYQVDLMDQRGADLGERMRNAFEEIRERGNGRVVIIGTDSPTLPVEMIRKAFFHLETHDLVLGPCLDGGYYLIGSRDKIPPVLDGIPWGTDLVLGLTLRKVTDHKIKCALLPFWYDVDTIEDLRFLSSHLEFLDQQGEGSGAAETKRVLKDLKF